MIGGEKLISLPLPSKGNFAKSWVSDFFFFVDIKKERGFKLIVKCFSRGSYKIKRALSVVGSGQIRLYLC